MNKFKLATLIATSSLFVSCSVPVRGVASLTLLSDQQEKISKNYKVIGEPVKGEMCLKTGPFFLFWWGKQPIHESLLNDMQLENNADAFINSTFKTSFFMIPYIFSKECVSIEGTPVVLKGKGK